MHWIIEGLQHRDLDVTLYANIDIPASKMQLIREELEKNDHQEMSFF